MTDGRRPEPRQIEVRRILVDGRNVQYAIARGTAGGSARGSLPTPVFVAQLRAAIPAGAKLELILDGFPSGGVSGHVSPGLDVSYSRHRSADQAIAERVRAAAGELGPVGIDAVLVVSDDREVGAEARRHGARVVGTAWLIERMRAGSRGAPCAGTTRARAGTSLGHGRPPRRPRGRC
jgi:hypothetical protein